MTRIIMSGCSGRMGRMITGLVKDTEGAEIVALLELMFSTMVHLATLYIKVSQMLKRKQMLLSISQIQAL